MKPTVIAPSEFPPPQDDGEFQPVYRRLEHFALTRPTAEAIVVPRRRWFPRRGYRYRRITFAELWQDVQAISAGLVAHDVVPGMRIALMVPFSPDMIATVFALLRVGAVQILIDPALGRRSMIDCLAAAEPEGLIGIPLAQGVRWLSKKRFPKYHLSVTSGGFWPRPTLDDLRQTSAMHGVDHRAMPDDPAAIIFTSGSTGPPKGVLYTHGTFAAQVNRIREQYGILPGGRDLACFPLFGLFNAAMGTSTVIPDMNPAKPAAASPRKLVAHIQDLKVNQSFASPAIWNNLGRYCAQNNICLTSLRRILAAGAPVAPRILQRLQTAVPEECEMFTPYGATEALPIASISAKTILQETAPQTAIGRGICVGNRFRDVSWKIIQIDDHPIRDISDAIFMEPGHIGELIVSGPQVTARYVTSPEANSLHKIRDGKTIWHRMGDVGFLDDCDRFWFCGRKSHRVRTPRATLFTIPCEAIFNQHPAIYRSALVGVGPVGNEIPYVVAETWPEYWPPSRKLANVLRVELFRRGQAFPFTKDILMSHIVLKRKLPVDVRHNAKIFREELKRWLESRA
jgi:olefin beta-lactone synthetase